MLLEECRDLDSSGVAVVLWGAMLGSTLATCSVCLPKEYSVGSIGRLSGYFAMPGLTMEKCSASVPGWFGRPAPQFLLVGRFSFFLLRRGMEKCALSILSCSPASLHGEHR